MLEIGPNAEVRRECDIDEVGEICVKFPGAVAGQTYIETDKNQGLYVQGDYLPTGDLGRFASDSYIWITGRAKDLIIRGGHNIDPAEIEACLAGFILPWEWESSTG